MIQEERRRKKNENKDNSNTSTRSKYKTEEKENAFVPRNKGSIKIKIQFILYVVSNNNAFSLLV